MFQNPRGPCSLQALSVVPEEAPVRPDLAAQLGVILLCARLPGLCVAVRSRNLPLSRHHVQGPRCNVSQLTYHLAAADRVQSTLFSRATVLYAQAWVLRDGCLLGLHRYLKGPCGASAGVEPVTQHPLGCHTLASSCPGPFPL